MNFFNGELTSCNFTGSLATFCVQKWRFCVAGIERLNVGNTVFSDKSSRPQPPINLSSYSIISIKESASF